MEKTMFKTYIEKDKFDKLCDLPTTDRIRLVYEWIKTGQITLRQFEFICEQFKMELGEP